MDLSVNSEFLLFRSGTIEKASVYEGPLPVCVDNRKLTEAAPSLTS